MRILLATLILTLFISNCALAENTGGWFYKVVEQDNQNNLDQAIAEYTKTISIDANNSDAYCNRGIIYGKQGRFDKAVADLSKAISLDPNNSKAYNGRGVVYDDQGRFDQAIADFTKAISIDPKNSNAYINRGTVYSEQGQFEQAIIDCTTAISIDPNNSTAYYNRGLNYYKQGNFEQAIVDCNKAISVNPNNSNAYYNRGIVYSKHGNFDQAIADFTKATTIEPKNSNAFFNLARIYYKELKNYTSALEYINKAIALDDRNEDCAKYTVRAGIYYKTGSIDEAIADYNTAIKNFGNKDNNLYYYNPYYNLAVLYYNQGNSSSAIKYSTFAINVEPTFAEAYYLRGQCYDKQGNVIAANQDYAKAKALSYKY